MLWENVKQESLGFVFIPVSRVSKEITGFSRAPCLPSSVELGVFLATLSLDFRSFVWTFANDLLFGHITNDICEYHFLNLEPQSLISIQTCAPRCSTML